jgi:hypothetical protein
MTPQMMVTEWLLISCYVHVTGEICPGFFFTASSTGFFFPRRPPPSLLRVFACSKTARTACRAVQVVFTRRWRGFSGRILGHWIWVQTQACVYVSVWILGQNQDHLLDLNTCYFVCLVLEKDVEVSRPQDVLRFC